MRFFKESRWVYPVEASEATDYSVKYENQWYSKLPHKKGDKANCGNPLGKDYLPLVENGSISSPVPDCLQLLKDASMLTYWTSMQERVGSMKVVKGYNPVTEDKDTLLYLPQQATHRTITRRAGDRLIYTSSKAKKSRLGSELRSRVWAPKGHSLIMADFDSQELRLGAMYADSRFGFHGATPMGYGVIAGSKERGDDPHTLLAKEVGEGADREAAKVYKYASIYGAGVAGLANYIKANSPTLSSTQTRVISQRAQKHMKGKRVYVDEYGVIDPNRRVYRDSPAIWVGGTDSECYNFMEIVANSQHPTSPILGSRITEALVPSRVQGQYLTSRINWVIQTSGTDILHLFLVAVTWLFRHYRVNASVIQSLHDEVVSISRRGHEAIAVRCYNIAHLLAWSVASERIGIFNLPESYAWFSGVAVDCCWRKSPSASQVTPSNAEDPPNGLEVAPDICFSQDLDRVIGETISTWG